MHLIQSWVTLVSCLSSVESNSLGGLHQQLECDFQNAFTFALKPTLDLSGTEVDAVNAQRFHDSEMVWWHSGFRNYLHATVHSSHYSQTRRTTDSIYLFIDLCSSSNDDHSKEKCSQHGEKGSNKLFQVQAFASINKT